MIIRPNLSNTGKLKRKKECKWQQQLLKFQYTADIYYWPKKKKVLKPYRRLIGETFLNRISSSNLGIASVQNNIGAVISVLQVALQPSSRKISNGSAPPWQHHEFPTTKIRTNIASNTSIQYISNKCEESHFWTEKKVFFGSRYFHFWIKNWK